MIRSMLIAGTLCLAMLLAFLTLDWRFPLPETDPGNHTTMVLAEDGSPLRVFADKLGVWRFKTSLQDVSPLYIEALLGYEDRYFYWHPGINPVAIVRAAIQNLRNDEIVSGASTLTMQVARLIDPHSHRISGKLRQLFRALQLERHYSKDEILERYLELAPFGGNLLGVEAASQAYFNKSPLHLSHAEAALLAVLPQAPSRYRPDRHPLKAAHARNKLAQRLVDQGTWSEEVLRDIAIEPVYARAPSAPSLAPILTRRLKNRYPAQSKITTSINYGLQLAIEARLKDYVRRLPPGTTAAAVVVENKNWLVRAYVGSALFADAKTQGYVDMVSASRSPGSTPKPFIYGLALDQSLIHSQSLLVDAPRWNSDYRPENFSGGFSGAVSAQDALQKSLNIPAVQLLESLSPEFFNSRLLNAGVTPKLPSGKPNLAMALGGLGLPMESLLSLYGSLARGGQVTQLRYSPDQPWHSRPLLSPQAAWIVHSMLSNQARPGETTPRANVPLGFKTGTSYGYRDAWAFGVSGQYTLGVWVGRPDGTPSPGQFGAATALPLLFQINDWLGDNSRPSRPGSISEADICWPGGLRHVDTPPEQCHLRLAAFGIDGQFPATLPASTATVRTAATMNLRLAHDSLLSIAPGCPLSGFNKQIALWPLASEPWLDSKWQRSQLIPADDPRCPLQAGKARYEFEITSIKADAVIRHPENQNSLSLPLTTRGGYGKTLWYLDGRAIVPTARYASRIKLPAGRHELLAIDTSGASDRVYFEIQDW